MSRSVTVSLALAAALLATGCSKRKTAGLEPAQQWNADLPGMGGAVGAGPSNPHVVDPSVDPSDPHAGLAMGGMPGAGGADDPHAGIDMTGATNPHAGVDVSKLNLPPPDPNRKIDPAHHVKGVIRVDAKAKDKVKAGVAVFLVVKRADASGQPIGSPLAVEKLTWQGGDLPFELSELNAMSGGTELAGDVIVQAHYDQDGDALSKTPGDLLGQARVKIPADDVKIVLDTIL